MSVVVLGGGPAGLYAALRLARRGLPVTLLESEDRPGGLAAGTRISGMPVDFGSHRLHPSTEPDILGDIRELLGGELQERRRHGRIRLDGRWISFPISVREMRGALSPSTVATLARGAGRAVLTRKRSATFADVVATGLGRPMGDLFYFPYARKIWGVPPERLSGEQARRRIAADSPAKLLRKAFSSSGAGREFFYPRRGFAQIPEALSTAAQAAGAEVRLGSTVTSLHHEGRRIVVGAGGEAIEATLVLSTVPITALARLLGPPPRVRSVLASLRYRAMVLVYLTVPAGRWTPFDAHYFPGAEVPFTRISEPKNYRDGADPSGRTVLCVEIPCDPEDPVWLSDDSMLISTVREAVAGQDLPDPGGDGEVHRVRHAYPVYPVGVETALSEVAGWLDRQEGIVTFGRQGLYAHDNTHHTMAMARDAVASTSDDLKFDAPAWAKARERFAAHVVED